MAEEIKKTTRGRKPKTVVEEKEVKQESQVEEIFIIKKYIEGNKIENNIMMKSLNN